MFPLHIEQQNLVRWIVLIVLFGVLSGCVGVSPATRPQEPTADRGAARKDQARLEVDDEFGFTVTEVVRIGSDVRGDYQQALSLLQRDQLNEGIAVLEALIEQAPDITAPHIDLGVAYGRVGDHDKAEQSLQAALSLAPNHPVALNELGIVYRRTGRFDMARLSYERALGVLPGYHFALRNLGVLCDLYLNDLECALQNYENYAEIVSDEREVKIWIADIRNRLGASVEESQ